MSLGHTVVGGEVFGCGSEVEGGSVVLKGGSVCVGLVLVRVLLGEGSEVGSSGLGHFSVRGSEVSSVGGSVLVVG